MVSNLSRRAALGGAAALVFGTSFGKAWAQAPEPGPFVLEPLPYPTAANEPHVDAKTMEVHHDKHHAAYVRNLNTAVAQHPDLAKMPLSDLLAGLDKAPADIRTSLRNNGGGHANHTMFWQIMGGQGGEPTGEIRAAIDRDLGGFAGMQSDFEAAGTRQFGSGWVFVTVARDGKLALAAKPNQDTPMMEGGRVLFGNDVWEHAYYLTYQNRRADYLKAWWNVVNWPKVAERYAAAKAGTLAI